MSLFMKRSRELRNDPGTHFNCAQGVFIPFAEQKGLTFEQAQGITANFGSGMRSGLTCGAITGGLMALGLYGLGGGKDSAEFMRRMKEKHEGRTACRDLLAAEVKRPQDKKAHCDNMVYEAVEIVEDMLIDRGILTEECPAGGTGDGEDNISENL